MTYTYDDSLISDLHKDAYGFRPSQYFWQKWHDQAPAEKQLMWDSLLDDLHLAIAASDEMQRSAIEDFEKQIAGNLLLGAHNRKQAIDWIMQGLDVDGSDPGYVCYLLGLPFSMETEFTR